MTLDTSSRSEQRKFGIVMAVAIAVLGLIRWALHGFAVVPTYFFSVAAVFLALGLVAPFVLRPVLIVWMKFAEALNWLTTRVLLTLAFFLLIVPVRVIMLLVRHDPLNRAWDPAAESYWEEAEDQPKEFERYLDQF
ncbi:MAG TPA: SxtJ family membrane protein [Candidatus Hydrogenedentes bacterium]|nr:SxtJ family membrane protein [Candidatus Hydrogenedentota bacterium]HOT50301.1 SxtJ family membrane protein [Candidatus Hydrogenedentota bacterium]HOV74094.1 SxtJ family membrane protein [Candidatus Hydrogenedentota bacterium]HPC15920.1 SxtJ family membrane protein [Candidatus Hydrogenedentota bacterium]HRT19874.1 SxtJ family membrane protein [Candidatus Hydrogenedentota bacterium]